MVDTSKYPPEFAKLAETFKEETGYWPDIDDPQVLDQAFFEALLELYDRQSEDQLDAKTEALIQISLTSGTTGLHPAALRAHIRTALDVGASVEEICNVFYLTVQLGNHALFEGAALLSELETSATTSGGNDDEIINRLRSQKPYWEHIYPQVLALYEFEPDTLESIMDLTHHAFVEGELDRKTIELISLAVDISTNHLYLSGAKTHVQNAIDAGATPAEIIEVCRVVSTEGLQTLETGIPILLEESDR